MAVVSESSDQSSPKHTSTNNITAILEIFTSDRSREIMVDDDDEGLPITAILPHIVLSLAFITSLVISFLRYRMKRRSRAMDQQQSTFMRRAMSIKVHGQRIHTRWSTKRLRSRHISPESGFGVMRLHNALGRMPIHLVSLPSGGPPPPTPSSEPPSQASRLPRSPPTTLDVTSSYQPDDVSQHPCYVVNESLPSLPVRLLKRQVCVSDVSDVISLPTDTPDDDVFRSDDDSLEVSYDRVHSCHLDTDDLHTEVTELSTTNMTAVDARQSLQSTTL